jgi:pantoate kinase
VKWKPKVTQPRIIMNSARQFQVFVPGHISGFFQPFFRDSPERTGSRNFGPCTSLGVWTRVSRGKGVEIYVNGKRAEPEPTLRVVRMFRVQNVRIEHFCELPIGCGFGVSGAWALGTALALSRFLGLKLPRERLVSMAHVAEVESRTGLGDVGAQNVGGVVLGVRPGAPPYGKWRRIPTRGYKLVCAVLGPLETKEFLGDEGFRKKAFRLGGKAMRKVLGKPNLRTAMEASLEFAEGLGLLDSELRELVDLCRKEGAMASQIMLGRAVFSFTREPGKLSRVLSETVGKGVLVCGLGRGLTLVTEKLKRER